MDSIFSRSFSLEEQLYYGSITTNLEKTDGKGLGFKCGTFSFCNDEKAKQIANLRNQPMSILGEEYNNLILPGIPATDYIRKEENISTLPPYLSTPLIKKENGQIIGLQSGIRSALLKKDGKWYRLKGCGNLYEGFPYAPVEDCSFPNVIQIRGCAFEHTTSRELYISGKIDQLLKEVGMEAANKPIGWWEYDIPNCSHPKVKRCCILMETLGNRRLGDNVLLGLEKLLPHLLDITSTSEALLKAFPTERIDPSNLESPFVPTAMVSLIEAFGGEQDFHDFKLNEKVPQKSELKFTFDSKWDPIWNESCEILTKHLPLQEMGSLLAHLYWRFGRECGLISRVLGKNNVSWGTYQDQMGFHCNAHINNLVLLPYDPSRTYLLSPLDFDMAFFKETFSYSNSKFEEWEILETNGMKMVLAGDTETSTGVTASICFDQPTLIVRSALRDTMMVAFKESFEGKEDRHPLKKNLHIPMYALLKLALIVTETETA